MKFSDNAIIISAKKHSENSIIIKLLSQNNGICRGFIKNAINSKSYCKYQIGNLVSFDLYAKNTDSLAYIKVESLESFASKVIFNINKLNIISFLCLIIDQNSMDQDSEKLLFDNLLHFLQNIDDPDLKILTSFVKFELDLLEISGYGLDLSNCAISGVTDNLYFISPKTGRAANYLAAQKYQNKLFRLTKFLKKPDNDNLDYQDLLASAKITEFFIKKYLSHKNIDNILNLRTKIIQYFEKNKPIEASLEDKIVKTI